LLLFSYNLKGFLHILYCSFLHPRIILRLGWCESSICLDTKTNQKCQDSIKKPTLLIFKLNKIILFVLYYFIINVFMTKACDLTKLIFDFATPQMQTTVQHS